MRDGLVAGWLAFAYLAVGVSPAHHWLDSGELAAAGWDLGVAHPPGIPGLTLLLRLATLVPVGSLGFRMALASAALGAVAVGMVVAILRRHAVPRPLAYGAAVWVLVGLTFVRQARVVEVYALAAALLMVTLWGFDPTVGGARRTSRRLIGLFAAVWATWCFGDLRLALVPLCVIAWAWELRAGRAWTRWAPVVVAMASAVLLAIPLSSASGPVHDWGNPQTAKALWDHVMAASITSAYADEILPRSVAMWSLHASETVGRLAEDLGPPGIAAVLIAGVRLWVVGPRAIAAALTWLWAVELFYAIGVNPMGGIDRQTGLVFGPLAALMVAHQLAAALGARPWVRFGVWPLVGTVLVLPAALVGAVDRPVTSSWGAHAWTREALAQLPPGALLLTQSDDLSAGAAAAQALEGARPDVVSVPGQHLVKPPSEAALAAARSATVWRAAAGATTERDAVTSAITAWAGPVAVENAGVQVFAGVPWWSPVGELPLRIAPASAVHPPREIPDQVAAWLSRLPTEEDRKRLAVALANDARGRIKMTGDVPRAIALLQLSLSQVQPDHASALVTLGALLHGTGRRDEGIALTRRALELDPGRSAALTNLAMFLAADPATVPEALTLAERAAALRPWRPDVWDRLAQIRTLAGDAAGAADAAARARG
jgi:tetratricopeptide (TPR) repeat protein